MAELQVGIRADVRDGRKVVRTLKEIRQAAGQSNATLNQAAKSAKTASTGYQLAAGSAGRLAGATDLTAAANAALATTMNAASAAANRESVATKAAAASQTQLSAATRIANTVKTKTIALTDGLTASMARLRTMMTGMWAGPTAGMKRFGAQARTAAGSVAGFSAGAAGIGATLAVGLGVGIKSAVDFEKTLSRITGLVGIAADEVKAFEKPLLDISKATTKGPNELADALFFITSAGARGKDALDILEASAKAAAAGLGETKQVADAVTSAVNAYGSEALSASMATDILTKTVREGKAEADSIASSLGRVLPIAANLGVGMDQVGATIAALTRQGLDANEATTSLRASLATLIKPTAEAEQTLAQLSQQNLGTTLTFGDLREMLATGDKNILEVFELMNKAVGGSGDALVKLVPNIRANAGVFSLLGKNLDDNRKIFDSLADSAGTTDDAFEAYKNTTSFELNEALNVLKITLQEIGDKLLPAVTKAFVWLAQGVEKTVDAFEGLGEAVARAIGGADEPVERLQDNLRDVEEALQSYQRAVVGDITGIGEDGNLIWEEREGLINDARRALINFAQSNNIETDLGNIDLSGTFDENLRTLEMWRSKLQLAIEDAKDMNNELDDTGDIIEEIVVNAKKRTLTPVDPEVLKRGQQALRGLRSDVGVLEQSLTDLATKGAEGLGLAEDARDADKIFRQLQGTVEGLTEEDIVRLLQRKRQLEDAVARVTQKIQMQAAAFDFLAEVERDTGRIAAQFAAIEAGGSLIDIQTAQQAADIFRDLGDQTTYTKDQIQQMLLEQQAWNAALEAMDPTGFQDIQTFIKVLQEKRAIAQTAEDVERLDRALMALGDSAIESVAEKYGVSADDIDFTPVAEKLRQAEIDLRQAWKLSRVIDPDEDPEFEKVLQKIQDKITGVSNIMDTFAEHTAKSLADTFSEFLFDPFDADVKDMVKNFADSLRRMVSDLIAQELLLSFFRSLSSAGGGWGALGQAAVGALSGQRAEGGPVQAGQSYLVGENGPEIMQPRQSGTVIPNDMIGGGQMPAPQVNVEGPTIVNTIRDDQIVSAFNRGGGGQVILNDMSEKQSAYRNALGIRN